MINRRSQPLSVAFLFWDLLSVSIAWVGAYYIRFKTTWIPLNSTDVPSEHICWNNLPLVLLLTVVSFRFMKLYDVHRLRRFREELVAVVKATALLALLALATIFFVHSPYMSRIVMFLFSCLTTSLVLTARRLTWAAVHWLRRNGYNPSFAVIVGTGRVARKTSRALRHASWMGIKNLGYIEDNPTRWSSDLDILGTTADLPRLIEKYSIEDVFIALPMNRYHEARRVYDTLSRTCAEVRLVADVPNFAGLSLTTTYLDGMPIVGLRESPHYGLNVIIKRAMDIFLAALALVIFSPLMVLVALAVKLSSRGPVFFRQERCGLNGRSFQMLKFRSMRLNAEEGTGPVMARKDDDRYTPIGGFLRRTSLDELPQFINVLLGDMSMVGPRPERPAFIQKFSETIPNYTARHSVKCGVTGWAQVNGWRGNTSLRKRIQFDLYYITHWNPWFDLRIIVLTVVKVLFHRHAY